MEDANLTKRESEIAELFAWGASKKDVANRLNISERTVIAVHRFAPHAQSAPVGRVKNPTLI